MTWVKEPAAKQEAVRLIYVSCKSVSRWKNSVTINAHTIELGTNKTDAQKS